MGSKIFKPGQKVISPCEGAKIYIKKLYRPLTGRYYTIRTRNEGDIRNICPRREAEGRAAGRAEGRYFLYHPN